MSSVPVWIIVLALAIVGGLEGFALSRGVDGIALSISVGVIGALAGAKVGELFTKK